MWVKVRAFITGVQIAMMVWGLSTAVWTVETTITITRGGLLTSGGKAAPVISSITVTRHTSTLRRRKSLCANWTNIIRSVCASFLWVFVYHHTAIYLLLLSFMVLSFILKFCPVLKHRASEGSVSNVKCTSDKYIYSDNLFPTGMVWLMHLNI